MPETFVGKYMKAAILPPEKGRKTRSYVITEINGEAILGHIRWYAPWRGYCFFPACGVVFDGGCLTQIVEWLGEITRAYKKERGDYSWID